MPGFEVGNLEIELTLKKLGHLIKDGLPNGWGFNLMIFDYKKDGSMFYISSATRQTMIEAMKEFIEKNEEKGGK